MASKYEDYYKNHQRDYQCTVNGKLRKLVIRTKQSASKKNLEHTITNEDVFALWEKQGGKCAKTGIQLDPQTGTVANRNPYGPSLDRINSGLGYTPDNIELVCCHYNLAKAAYSEEQFFLLASAYLEYNKHNWS